MDTVTLLAAARRAGLSLHVEGDRLVVRGPRSAERLARRLLARKPEIVGELTRRQRGPGEPAMGRCSTPFQSSVRRAVEILGGEILHINPARLDLDERHGLEANRKRIHQYPSARRRS